MLKGRGTGKGTKAGAKEPNKLGAGAARQAGAIQRKRKRNEGEKSSRMETERCPLDLATGRSEGKWQGEENRLEWVAKRVGGEGMEEIHVNSTTGQHSPLICQKSLK